MRRSLALVFSVAALSPSSADAICGREPDARVFPPRGVDAPINTHVFIRLQFNWQTVGFCFGDEPAQNCIGGEFDIELRTAPSTAAPASVVAIDRRDSISGITASVELIPKADLLPHTTYEVWCVDRKGRARSRIIGVFATGESKDTTSPTSTGIMSATLYHRPKARGGVILLDEECGATKLTIETTPPTDDGFPETLRAAIWIGPEKGPIDYTQAPRIYEPINEFKSPRGDRTSISVGNTDPTFDDLGLPIDHPLRIGMKIVDLAGNASPASETIAN